MERAPGHRTLSAKAALRACRCRAVSVSQTRPAALFLLAAVIAVLSVRGNGIPFVCFVPAASVLLAWLILPRRSAILQFALPMLAVLISAWSWNDRQRNVVAESVGHARFAAEAEFVVADPSASMRPEKAFRVKHMSCRLKRLRFGADAPWIEFERPWPEVMVDCRGGSPAAVPLGYGDLVLSEGVFSLPDKPLLPGSFDYADYLEQEGVYELFRPETFRVLSRGAGLRHTLYSLRDTCLAKICSGFRGTENIRMAGAMLGGRRISLDSETRAGFLTSGTVHILTVSGTHVAIAASLLLLLTIWVPFRLRCLAVLLPLLVYTLSTGMREPAMRAFTMICVFLLLRSLLIRSEHMNSLMLAAYVILLVSPGSLMKPGMHYSFTAVALLLSVPENFGRTLFGFFSRGLSTTIPMRYCPRRVVVIRAASAKLLGAVAGAAVASLGSGVLTILYQGLFPVSAVPANVLVLPLTYLVFILAAAAACFAWLPPVCLLLSGLLEYVFRLIGLTGRFFGGLCESSVPKPPAWSVALFLAAFFVLLRVRRFRPAVVLSVLMAALFAFWCFRTKFLPRELLVADGLGAGTEPAVVITDPALGRADVVNVPDYRLGTAMADWLASRGIGVCRVVAVSSGRKASFDGLDAFSARIPVLDVVCPSNARNKMPDGPAVSTLPYDGAFTVCDLSGDLFSFTIGTISGELLSNDSGNGRLTIRQNGRLIQDSVFTPGSSYRFHTQPIESATP